MNKHGLIENVRREGIIENQNRGRLPKTRHRVMLLLGFYNTLLHKGIMRFASEANWIVDDNLTRIGQATPGWVGDGILGLLTNAKDVELLSRLPKLPLVDLSKGWISPSMPSEHRKPGERVPRVIYDNTGIGRIAAEHFITRGFHDIAYMNHGNYWMETERIPSFRQTVIAAGHRYHEIQFFRHMPDPSCDLAEPHKKAYNWLIETIKNLPKPLGIAASCDNIARKILQACDDANICVPEEVAVLGCDNDPMVCNYTLVPLSSVDCDWESIGYEGAKLLNSLMQGNSPPREPVVISPRGVVTRMSTNILAVPDEKIAGAIRFIWENYDRPIGTNQVAAAAGLNRRKLERGFKTYIGQTVNQEISLTRITHAKNMLLSTQLKTHEIAEKCGFNSISYFSKIFLQITGLRPSEYRKKKSANN